MQRSSKSLARISKDGRWVTVSRVWHWRAKRYIYRRDGKPFRFRIG